MFELTYNYHPVFQKKIVEIETDNIRYVYENMTRIQPVLIQYCKDNDRLMYKLDMYLTIVGKDGTRRCERITVSKFATEYCNIYQRKAINAIILDKCRQLENSLLTIRTKNPIDIKIASCNVLNDIRIEAFEDYDIDENMNLIKDAIRERYRQSYILPAELIISVFTKNPYCIVDYRLGEFMNKYCTNDEKVDIRNIIIQSTHSLITSIETLSG